MKPQNPKKPVSIQSRLIKPLSRVKGGSMNQLERELGWQPHTIRAANSRLRTSGKIITTNKTVTGTTVCRLVVDAGVVA